MATVISVSIVATGPKGCRTATGMPTGGSRHPKTGNPAPFQISPASPYMLMNLGQRDEPSHSCEAAHVETKIQCVGPLPM